jgi:methanogenic corrinoid protein MtbC1
MSTRPFVSQSEIERETGFGNDQLRKWRQRFGFPPLDASGVGKTAYASKTVDQLLLIKRLLEAGFRPGQLLSKSVLELEKLKLAMGLMAPDVDRNESTNALVEQLKQTDLQGFRALLEEERRTRTLLDFLCHTVTPLMISIGDAWSREEIDIYHEHLCTFCVERYLQSEILKLKPRTGLPTILFALAPKENHLLGLLMAEAVLAEQGAMTINMGSDVPLNDLKLAAISCKADVLALSFSFAYPARNVVPTLLHLRRLLPQQIQIWAGGAGLSGVRKQPHGVRIISDLKDAVVALNGFDRRQPTP